MRLQKLTNNDLWKEWKEAIDDWATDIENKKFRQRVDLYEDEIIRRIALVVKKPLGVQA